MCVKQWVCRHFLSAGNWHDHRYASGWVIWAAGSGYVTGWREDNQSSIGWIRMHQLHQRKRSECKRAYCKRTQCKRAQCKRTQCKIFNIICTALLWYMNLLPILVCGLPTHYKQFPITEAEVPTKCWQYTVQGIHTSYLWIQLWISLGESHLVLLQIHLGFSVAFGMSFHNLILVPHLNIPSNVCLSKHVCTLQPRVSVILTPA